MERKTKQQIIEETFNYYNEDPSRRAKTNGKCQYLDVNGNMCAFGRCEINPPLSKGISDSVTDRFDAQEEMDQALKEEYRGHSFDFWSDLQAFHDNEYYWDLEAGKVDEEGVDEYQRLIKCWND